MLRLFIALFALLPVIAFANQRSVNNGQHQYVISSAVGYSMGFNNSSTSPATFTITNNDSDNQTLFITNGQFCGLGSGVARIVPGQQVQCTLTTGNFSDPNRYIFVSSEIQSTKQTFVITHTNNVELQHKYM